MTKRDAHRRQATAFHEAGHAVAALQVGLRIHSISVVPEGDAAGRVRHDNPLRGIRLDIDNSDRAYMRSKRAIIVCLAGPIAQRKFSPRSWRHYHGGKDHEYAADLALRACGDGRTATLYLRYLSQVTRNLVDGRWEFVTFVAHELLARKVIDGADLPALLQRYLQERA